MIIKYFTDSCGRLMRQPSFVICMVIMLICAVGLQAGAKWLQWNFRKEAAVLRKPLSDLDRLALEPYQVVGEIELPSEIEKELGTTIYINWTLEDTSVPPSDPARRFQLFVSYYTGDNSDKVPHVAEICRTANGGKIDNDYNTEISVSDCGLGDSENKLPIRILDVESPQINQRSQKQTVAYFFSVNGDYRCTRNQVRDRITYWR
ncbi:MAG: hypothetical protein GY869_18985, partial [Planctomycetes bacterium]|nr:hypothetical protein [Planctomycetota bacterium]